MPGAEVLVLKSPANQMMSVTAGPLDLGSDHMSKQLHSNL